MAKAKISTIRTEVEFELSPEELILLTKGNNFISVFQPALRALAASRIKDSRIRFLIYCMSNVDRNNIVDIDFADACEVLNVKVRSIYNYIQDLRECNILLDEIPNGCSFINKKGRHLFSIATSKALNLLNTQVGTRRRVDTCERPFFPPLLLNVNNPGAAIQTHRNNCIEPAVDDFPDVSDHDSD